MNVQPGDFAKIVNGMRHDGTLVHVEERASDAIMASLPLLARAALPGVWWMVTCLDATVMGKRFDLSDQKSHAPGSLTVLPDSWLRRVDPPPEVDEEPAPPQREKISA